MSDPTAGLGGFDGKKYLSLESFRKSGAGVRTPVWFAAAPADRSAAGAAKLYVYSTADSGKAKRIRRNPRIRIAPCDARGRVTGPWIDADAELVTGEEFDRGMRLLDRKYRPWKQLLGLFTRLSRHHERVVLAIRPTATGAPGPVTSGV